MRSHLYFAYADNMDEATIRHVCPGASFEGVGELKDYRFDFNQEGNATVIEDHGRSTWGVVWCLSSRDIYLLDRKEAQIARSVSRVNKNVRLQDGREVEAFLYQLDEIGKPRFNSGLLEIVIEQALYWALPKEHIHYLKGLKEGSLG